MTAVVLGNIGLSAGYEPLETGWGEAMNQNLRMIDALLQARVIDKDLDEAPAEPAAGAMYIVGADATGDWAGQDGRLALYTDGDDLDEPTWLIVAPRAGWRVYVLDESKWYRFTGTEWEEDLATLPTLTYAQDIGDGSETEISVNHLLGTRDVSVTVYRNSTPWETIDVTVERPTADIVTLSGFTGTPTAGEYRVVVKK